MNPKDYKLRFIFEVGDMVYFKLKSKFYHGYIIEKYVDKHCKKYRIKSHKGVHRFKQSQILKYNVNTNIFGLTR